MPKNNSVQPAAKTATVISKTMSGNQILATLQEGQGLVHTLSLAKEEASELELGDKVKITIQKVE